MCFFDKENLQLRHSFPINISEKPFNQSLFLETERTKRGYGPSHHMFFAAAESRNKLVFRNVVVYHFGMEVVDIRLFGNMELVDYLRGHRANRWTLLINGRALRTLATRAHLAERLLRNERLRLKHRGKRHLLHFVKTGHYSFGHLITSLSISLYPKPFV